MGTTAAWARAIATGPSGGTGALPPHRRRRLLSRVAVLFHLGRRRPRDLGRAGTAGERRVEGPIAERSGRDVAAVGVGPPGAQVLCVVVDEATPLSLADGRRALRSGRLVPPRRRGAHGPTAARSPPPVEGRPIDARSGPSRASLPGAERAIGPRHRCVEPPRAAPRRGAWWSGVTTSPASSERLERDGARDVLGDVRDRAAVLAGGRRATTPWSTSLRWWPRAALGMPTT